MLSVQILGIEIKPPRHELIATCEQSHEGYEQPPYDASQTGSYGSQDNALGSPAIDLCGQVQQDDLRQKVSPFEQRWSGHWKARFEVQAFPTYHPSVEATQPALKP